MSMDILNEVAKAKFGASNPRRRAARVAVEKLGCIQSARVRASGQNRSAFHKKKPDGGNDGGALESQNLSSFILHNT